MDEIWVDVMGFEGHYVLSNYGNINSTKNGKVRILNPNLMKDGYLRVSMSSGTVESKINAKMHRLVALHFVHNPDPINFTVVNHKNGISTDNRAINLEWCTIKYNNQHRFIANPHMNKGTNNPQCKLTEQQILEVYKLSHTTGIAKNYICDLYDISRETVHHIQTGRTHNMITKHKLIQIMKAVEPLKQF